MHVLLFLHYFFKMEISTGRTSTPLKRIPIATIINREMCSICYYLHKLNIIAREKEERKRIPIKHYRAKRGSCQV